MLHFLFFFFSIMVYYRMLNIVILALQCYVFLIGEIYKDGMYFLLRCISSLANKSDEASG